MSFTHRPTHNTHALSLSHTHTLSKSTIDEGVKIDTKIGEEPKIELNQKTEQDIREEWSQINGKIKKNGAKWKNGAR